MAIPILLVTGFLGAGKTTAVNHLLTQSQGKKIAAIVNDFGQINIDAELIFEATDDVISLANGCVCCSLEGELIRTLATLLKRDSKPDIIVIETSGIANPADVVRSLLDPFIWQEAPLEQVLCILDGTTPTDDLNDPLKQSQLRAADLIALTKLDLKSQDDPSGIREALRKINPNAVVVDAPYGRIPTTLLLPMDLDRAAPLRTSDPQSTLDDRFETHSWTADRPLSMQRFRNAIETLSPLLARAKGMIVVTEQPEKQMVFQLSGGRATLAPRPGLVSNLEGPIVKMVFIAEKGGLRQTELSDLLEGCVVH
jgi:Putative GTPases (G3E family)